jgi:hypothetical protein
MQPSAKANLISAIFTNLPWSKIMADIWKSFQRNLKELTSQGIYQVQKYEMHLTLHDPKGERASYQKQQKVRYLQNNVIAFHDQAWGDGEFLLNFRCSPGIAVDRYRIGNKTLTLISLRHIRNRGERDELNIEWDLKNSFTNEIEEWTTTVSHRTQKLLINIQFPQKRPPQKLWLIENNRRKQTELGKNHVQQTANGDWKFSWCKKKPRLYEDYIIRWQW